MQISKILVGVDFSEASELALRRAINLAQKYQGSLTVAHILKEVPYDAATTSKEIVEWMGKVESEVRDKITEWVQRVGTEGLEVQIRIETGIPYHALLMLADKLNSELLVMGDKGRSALSRFLAGSVTETLSKKSPVPLWVQKQGLIQDPQTVLIPTDLSPNSREGVIEGLDWVRRFGAKALILHVVEEDYIPSLSLIEPFVYEKKMRELGEQHFETFLKGLPMQGLEVENAIYSGDPVEEIVKVAETHKASVIALSTHGKSNLAYKPIGSIALKLLHRSPVSLLLTRPSSPEFNP